MGSPKVINEVGIGIFGGETLFETNIENVDIDKRENDKEDTEIDKK